jgi:hypothetical protein
MKVMHLTLFCTQIITRKKKSLLQIMTILYLGNINSIAPPGFEAKN